MGGFVLTSGHVITSFQGMEEPPAKPWTGLLKAQEESPEVSGGPRGEQNPCPQHLGLQRASLTSPSRSSLLLGTELSCPFHVLQG